MVVNLEFDSAIKFTTLRSFIRSKRTRFAKSHYNDLGRWYVVLLNQPVLDRRGSPATQYFIITFATDAACVAFDNQFVELVRSDKGFSDGL